LTGFTGIVESWVFDPIFEVVAVDEFDAAAVPTVPLFWF
jgi:hypothetical protein